MKRDETLLNEMVRTAVAKNVPISGAFELTPRCTLDCRMCYVHLNRESLKNARELSSGTWIDIVDEACENGLLFALLTGGECLMRQDFEEIYVHMREKGIITTVNTNGMLINDHYVKLFGKYPSQRIRISLYGSNEDEYELVTGQRVFERVIRNILLLRDSGNEVAISITPSKFLGKDQVVEIIRIAKRNGIPYTVNSNLIEAREGTGHAKEDFGISPEDAVEIASARYDLEGRCRYRNCHISGIPEDVKTETKEYGLECKAGRSSFAISWDGKMHPCLAFSEISVDVLENGFDAAWKIINDAVSRCVIPVECTSCVYKKVCSTCILKKRNASEPTHRNINTCLETVGKINAGLVKYERE